MAGRVGERQQVALQHLRRRGSGTVNQPRHRPSPSSSIRVSSTPAAARASSAASDRRLVGLPHLRGDDVEDPLADLPEVLGVVLERQRQQRRLRHGRASPRRRTAAARRPPRRSPLAWSVRSAPDGERIGDVGVPARAPAPSARSRRAARCVVRVSTASQAAASRSPWASAMSSDSASTRSDQRVELRPRLGQRHQRRLLLPRRHEGRLDRGHTLERVTEVGGTLDDRMHSPPSSTAHRPRPGSGAELRHDGGTVARRHP